MTLTELSDAVSSRQAILFVGSGISQKFGLPSWGELVDEMAKQLGFDPDVFRLHGDFLALAEYFELKTNSLAPLRDWMNKSHADEALVDSSRIHQAIVDLDFPTIYTTNYDRWLEIAFTRRKKKFIKIANVGDFAKDVGNGTQIVKLHGDLESDGALVLTETSYFDRLAFESPLDIKLRYDSIGKTILFAGYSMSDINVRYLLYKLDLIWADVKYAAKKPGSFIFLGRPNPVQEAILRKRGIEPIVSSKDDVGEGLCEFLEALVMTTKSAR